ncbi:hypothetical protein LWC34_11155 [Kibdelosporangium philippinense]|uniref:PH domain-containing protein n=1 Tax=Kibdelosporangium philippinense TaxID=211113 RepID=A0ABS8Z674_9PSEU|nr:hypothetical protein [Kibdelosporangium philippinense]MCE7003381.1 hypothetical protein [Kibdelosporangium philippinense]
MTDKPALELPHVLRSPWRWLILAQGILLVLVGMSGFVAGPSATGDLIAVGAMGVGGVLMIRSSRQSRVVVRAEHVEEHGLFWTVQRMPWTDIDEVTIGEGPSILPSKTVLLVGKNGAENLTLSSLSWYSLRQGKVPARAAEFQRTAAILMRNNGQA